MILCKHCGSDQIVKDGIVCSKQRYLCNACRKTTRYGDMREKYTTQQKIMVVKLYTEGMGIRAIERLENISSPLIIQWIRCFSKIIKDRLSATVIPSSAKEIEILELDELFTFYQKKQIGPMYGLLWTETGIKLLISR